MGGNGLVGTFFVDELSLPRASRARSRRGRRSPSGRVERERARWPESDLNKNQRRDGKDEVGDPNVEHQKSRGGKKHCTLYPGPVTL